MENSNIETLTDKSHQHTVFSTNPDNDSPLVHHHHHQDHHHHQEPISNL